MEKDNISKHYQTEEIRITWNSGLCTHACYCWKGLPEVFKPREKPWIHPENTDSETLMTQIQQCPSGALTAEYLKDIQ